MFLSLNIIYSSKERSESFDLRVEGFGGGTCRSSVKEIQDGSVMLQYRAHHCSKMLKSGFLNSIVPAGQAHKGHILILGCMVDPL